LTAQNTGGPLTIYNSTLPGLPLSCNYCTGEQPMKDAIAAAAAGWNGTSPRFIIIQAQPWTDVKPTNFKNVMNSLNSDYIVVRPDHLFQLLREANGLPVDPIPSGIDITDLAGGHVSAQYQTGSPTGEEYPNLIDNNVDKKYLTFNPSAWVQYQAPSQYVVTSYTISSANDFPERDPLSWTLQGSNNGSSWTTIDTRTNEDFPSRLQRRVFSFTNSTAYQYYRFNMSNNSGSILQLAEIELFGQAAGTSSMHPGTVNQTTTNTISQVPGLYPNPVSTRLYVNGLTNAARLEVYNSIGQRKLSASGRSIDVSSLEPGIYFLQFSSDQHSGTYKFVKIN